MYTPQLPALLVLLAGVAVQAVPSDDFFGSLMARQAPGTPAYQCHFDCGNAITGGRLDGHCTNSTWTNLYQECLECALDFDIWKYYGPGLAAPASACGLSTTPLPSGDDSAPQPTTSALTTSDVQTTTGDAPSPAQTTTADTTSPVQTTTGDDPSAAPTTTGASLSTTDSSATGVPTTPLSSTELGPTTTSPPAFGNGTNATSPVATSAFVTAGVFRIQPTMSLLGVGAMVVFGLKALL